MYEEHPPPRVIGDDWQRLAGIDWLRGEIEKHSYRKPTAIVVPVGAFGVDAMPEDALIFGRPVINGPGWGLYFETEGA